MAPLPIISFREKDKEHLYINKLVRLCDLKMSALETKLACNCVMVLQRQCHGVLLICAFETFNMDFGCIYQGYEAI